MSFEYISDVAEDDDNGDIEINIVEQNNFVSIDTPKTVLPVVIPFVVFWPEIAQKVLHAMYASKDEKRVAIAAFMKMFDCKYYEPEPLKLLTDDAHRLYKLYKTKLDMFEQEVMLVRTQWCDVLRACAIKCKQLSLEKDRAKTALLQMAKQLDMKYKSTDSRAATIVEEEYNRQSVNIDRTFEMRFKLAKTEYHVKIVPTNYDAIDDKIRQVDPQPSLEWFYFRECRNIEYRASKNVQYECEQYWMDALT